MFPLTVFPGDLVEIEKASFILCCSRQGMPHDWIGDVLSYSMIIGLILSSSENSVLFAGEIIYDDEWSSVGKEKEKRMYKTYVLGKIIKLDERCFGSKI